MTARVVFSLVGILLSSLAAIFLVWRVKRETLWWLFDGRAVTENKGRLRVAKVLLPWLFPLGVVGILLAFLLHVSGKVALGASPVESMELLMISLGSAFAVSLRFYLRYAIRYSSNPSDQSALVGSIVACFAAVGFLGLVLVAGVGAAEAIFFPRG